MNLHEFRQRITELRLQKNISEREMSMAMDKGQNYINSIVSGKANPSLSGLLEICEYFELEPYEFFDLDNQDPVPFRKIYNELKRLSDNNGEDMGLFLQLLETAKPDDYRHFIDYLTRLKITDSKKATERGGSIKQHRIVFGKRRSFGYAVSPFCRSFSSAAGSIPTRS